MTLRPVARRGGIAVLAALLVLGVRGDGRRTPFPSILLIVVDTLRADHLAAYGYPRETAPTITQLAADGARFSNAYSQGASTVPTFASLFTSRFPFQHGTQDVRDRLRALGYLDEAGGAPAEE